MQDSSPPFQKESAPAGVRRVPGAHLAGVQFRGRRQGGCLRLSKGTANRPEVAAKRTPPHKLPQSLGTSARFHNSGDPVDVVRGCTSNAQHRVWRTVAAPHPPQKRRKTVSFLTRLLPPRLRDLALSVPSPFTSQPQFAFLSCGCSWALGAPGNI